MYRFFGQPKYAGTNNTTRNLIGYELFIRQYVDGRWLLPQDFNGITADTLQHLLMDVVLTMHESVEMLSFNLEQNQFVDPAFLDMVTYVQDHTRINLFTELTERLAPGISEDSLVDAAAKFHHRGLLVCIDDVGTGENTPEMVLRMNDSVDEFKFAFQDFRPYHNIQEIEPQLNFWYHLARREHKMLAIEGVETAAELAEIDAHYDYDVVQGYLLGHPALLSRAQNSN
ncbi:EAL domain-containing protein [Lacticaseibacillus thailandensis]|uniref:C-di-GMP-specific phosphodiesterase n=1 Tax=Lacticaseibacillus thailandensis DSM 22698 = JCM 13996 TaxID=1423810 RepID=A0A0R2C5R9_9LACO|nr:EAL domain-containing protein [Lacticaseibacillus thailandensis]KRM87215.1 C-di-GMP-specific phosphodiesterase [Lacticaseibacillus thailandensis DSM 22698 = JCM 13996]